MLMLLRTASLVSLLALGACFCGPAQVADREAGSTTLRIDGDDERIVVSRGGRVLLDVPASRIGSKDGDAFYAMEFGMFDIQEDTAPYVFASDLVITRALPEEPTVHFDLLDDEGVVLVTGTASARTDRVELSLVAQGAGHDRLFVASSCVLEHALGFGAQSHDVDHVGQIVPSWVSEQGIGKTDNDELPAVWQLVGRRHSSHAPLPAFVTDRSAAYVLDTSAFARTGLCAPAPGATVDSELTFEVFHDALSLRVYAADTPRAAQAAMVDAFGRPPLPPPWALAPWNDALFGSASVRAYAARLREQHIPSSALWSEDWRGGADAGGGQYRLRENWRVDAALYPDFSQMVDDVNALGFHELVYFNPFVVQGADVFDEVIAGGFAIDAPLFPGADKDFSPTTLVDLTNDNARRYVKQHLKDALDLGARGWMADFAEWLPVEDTVLASGEDPALLHNRYPVLWQEVQREALEEAGLVSGNDAAVVFVRSAWLGSQPLAQVIWAGDQRTSFHEDDGLPTILPIGIGLSAVGFPFVTHDVAGYQSATNDPVDKELFLRWTTLGALSPIMRTHHGTHAVVNVNLFTDDDTIAHWRRWAQLHVRLYPYLRRLALDATSPGGAPLWVPLPLTFPNDDVWAIKDEVMLGSALMLAPVVTQGELAREVVFPSARFAAFPLSALDGAPVDAFDATFGDPVDGPATLVVDVAVTELALFIIAGGIVPMTATPADTLMPDPDGEGPLEGLESTEGDRVVIVGLGADGSFTEESGASYALTGVSVTVPASNEPDAAVVITGNGAIEGEGFTLTLEGHPDERTTRVIFR